MHPGRKALLEVYNYYPDHDEIAMIFMGKSPIFDYISFS